MIKDMKVKNRMLNFVKNKSFLQHFLENYVLLL